MMRGTSATQTSKPARVWHLLRRFIGLWILAVAPSPGRTLDLPPPVPIPPALIAIFEGEISLSGRIVDAAGTPLRDVSVTQVATYLNTHDIEQVKWDSLLREETGFMLDSPEFHITCEGCTSLQLVFRKPGYRAALLGTGLARIPLELRETPTEVAKLDQVVILESAAGHPSRLERISGKLTLGGEHNREVLVLSEGSRAEMPISDVRDAASRGVRHAYVQLVASEAFPSSDPLLALPNLMLDFSQATGGLQPYQPEPDAEGPHHAPERGYATALRLDAERQEPLFFYCRTGLLYCHGYITPPEIEITGSGSRITAGIVIEINRDHDTDLGHL